MMRIVLSSECLAKVVDSAYRSVEELVFFCIGEKRGDTYIVRKVIQCKNVAKNPLINFVADPICTYKTLKQAEELGLDVVAIIHSHPAKPYPSSEDLKGMRLWPCIWIIVDSNTKEVRAWRLDDGNLYEVSIDCISMDCDFTLLSEEQSKE